MGRSGYKILISLVLAFIFASAFHMVIQSGARKFYSHTYSKLKTIFDSSSYYDIVFIGSSRIHSSIDPRIVDSISGLTSFNAGLDGAGVTEFKMMFDGYLSKHPAPKQIILGLDAHSFNDARKFVRYNLYLNFLNNTTVYSTLSRNRFIVFPYKVIPCLKLIEMDDMAKRIALQGLFGKNEIGNNVQYHGFLSNGSACIDPSVLNKTQSYRFGITQQAMAGLRSMIGECSKRKIGLLLMYAPEYDHKFQASIQSFDSIINVIDTIAIRNDLRLLRDDSLNICREKCFFANYEHLNSRGAAEYSRIWGARLKSFRENNSQFLK